MKKALKLDVTSDKHDMFEGMEDTYRREGLTVGSDYMRIYGVDFNVSLPQRFILYMPHLHDTSIDLTLLTSQHLFATFFPRILDGSHAL